MSPMRRTASIAAAGVVGAVALTGCGGQVEGRADAPASSSPVAEPSRSTTTASTSASPTASATASASASGSASTGPLEPVDALLSARALPGLDASWQWSVQRTTVDPTVVGVCGRVPMQTLGAEEAVTRTFVPTGDDGGGTARQVVARFVDDRSADQAQSVLEASRTNCRSRLTGYTSVTVGAPELVDVSTGQASWYLTRTVTRGPRQVRFNTLGMIRSGTVIELIELDIPAVDNTHEADAPMPTALERAARLLG